MTRFATWILLLSLSLLPGFLTAIARTEDGLTISLGLTSVYVAYQYGPRMRRPGWQLPSAVLSFLLIMAAMGPVLALRFDLSGFNWGDIEMFMATLGVRGRSGRPTAPRRTVIPGRPSVLRWTDDPHRRWSSTYTGRIQPSRLLRIITGLQAIGLVLALQVYYRLPDVDGPCACFP